ncbi:nucleoplasmin-2 isoform X3 [Desmodus rotundus]|uniref:nucleoplasmin-2 isoform X3 n=1 Tax=Desmodus rotundus TaxID=9430 RepID=UPI002381307C|nr:nucleoplasmin-2 isoform X3 [Desmodus rotundus]
MHRSRATSTADRATATLWGCELNQEKRTWTFKQQKEGKQDCKVLLSTVGVMMGLELSPPVTFQLRAGSGPVFLSGQECHDDTLEEEEEEEEEEVEEEEPEEEDEEDDEEDDDVDVSLEETPVKPGKRLVPQKQSSVTKKKKMDKEEEVMRPSLKDKSPVRKAKATPRAKKPGFKK